MNKLRFVGEDETNIPQRKKDLRAYMRVRRGDNENRDVKERLIIDNFLSVFEEMQGAGMRSNVFCYLSYSSETPTDTLIEQLKARGAKLYAPRIEDGEMFAVELGDDFTLSPLGIREPVGEPFLGDMDVVITPCFAVDKQGNRLGYGGGYYDKFFARNTGAKRVAICYDFQLLPSVPCELHDVKVQYVVTDKRVIKI